MYRLSGGWERYPTPPCLQIFLYNLAHSNIFFNFSIMARPKKEDTYRNYNHKTKLSSKGIKALCNFGEHLKEQGIDVKSLNIASLTARLATGRSDFWEEEEPPTEINPLKCTLSKKQVEQMLTLLNSSILSVAVTVEQAMNFLKGELAAPVVIANTRLFSFLLKNLSDKGLICSNYQTTIQRLNLYVSKQGKRITQRKISSALTIIDRDYANLVYKWNKPLTHCQTVRLGKYKEIEKICNKLAQ